MSAAIEDQDAISVGDSVFVDPQESAPVQLRGVHGTVIALEGVEALLQSSMGNEVLRVDLSLLRRNRRRARRPVSWEVGS